jgi:tripartite-type tricarboxylate transporter receptor subunit TctC
MKRSLAAVVGCLALTVTAPAQAQNYPTKQITWVVPNTAGSTTDVISRMISGKLSERLKQTIVIENKAGANTQIAAEAVSKAPADGYTLFFTTNTSHSANPVLYTSLRYDPIKDFTPIVRTGQVPFILLVNPSLPVKNTAELIAYAKANPGKLSYAYPVSAAQVSAETLKVKAGIDMVGVPYSGSPQALTDLMSGQIEVYFCDLVSARPHIESGKVRALAVTTMTRSKFLPDLPPVADTVPGFNLTSWSGVFAGGGNVPKPIVDRLSKEITEIMQEKDVQAQLDKLGFELFLTKDQGEFATFVSDQLKLWATMVNDAKIPKTQN